MGNPASSLYESSEFQQNIIYFNARLDIEVEFPACMLLVLVFISSKAYSLVTVGEGARNAKEIEELLWI